MNFSLPFVRRDQIALHTYAFYFDRKHAAFDFLPGQFVSVTLPSFGLNGLEGIRDFTVASSPLDSDFLSIVTKPGLSEFKKRLFLLEPGEKVEITKPAGGFVLDTSSDKPHVFLAGGVGIVPFYGMISHHVKGGIKMTLIASFSTIEDAIYREEMNVLGDKHMNVWSIFTQDRITEDLIRKYAADFSMSVFYLAGPEGMVEEMEKLLEKMGVRDVRVEYFSGYTRLPQVCMRRI